VEEVAQNQVTFQSKLTADPRRKKRENQLRAKKKRTEGEQPGYIQPTVGGMLTASAEYSRSLSRSPMPSSTPIGIEGFIEPGAIYTPPDSLRHAAERAGAETRTRRREKYITRSGGKELRKQRVKTVLAL